MPKTRRRLTDDRKGFDYARGIIHRWLGNGPGIVLGETKAIRLIQQEFSDTKAEIQRLLRSDDMLRAHPSLTREVSSKGKVSFQLAQPAQKCPVCNGEMAPGKYDHVVGNEHFTHFETGQIRWLQHIILDVPAMICTTCGSPWVRADDRVMGRLQAYVRTCAEQDVFVSTINYVFVAATIH
jgi:hypothetical protein